MHFVDWIGRASNAAGMVIGNLKLNCIRMPADPRRPVVLKRRRWYSPVVIAAGALYIRLFGLRVRVLQDRAWLQRELALYRDLYGEQATVHPGGWLEVPCIGEALSLFLTNPARGTSDKLRALASAARELRRVHLIAVQDGGAIRLFSHGDASARNVACAPESDRAHWFDFEIAHAPGCPDEWRHADDLRALLFSALAILPETIAGECIDAILDAYDRGSVFQSLHERVASGSLECDTYHLAQLQVSPARHEHLANRIALKLEDRIASPSANGRQEQSTGAFLPSPSLRPGAEEGVPA